MDNEKKAPQNRIQRIASAAQKKAGEIGNRAADAAQKAAKGANGIRKETAKRAAEAAADVRQRAEMGIYKPVFTDDYDKPKMIVIADDENRKDVEICKGAIGWASKTGGLEVLHLYEDFVPTSDIVFFPQPQLDSVYYQDALDSSRYISLDCYFDTVQKDKFTELKRIAFELGAKKCRLESYEETKSVRVVKGGAGVGKKGRPEKALAKLGADGKAISQTQKSIVFSQTFEGNNHPRRPELKWFAHDKEIEFLIDTRCNGDDAGKTKEYSMELSSMAMQTMNVQTAIKIDKALAKLGAACNFSLKGEALTEQRRTLVFEIEF